MKSALWLESEAAQITVTRGLERRARSDNNADLAKFAQTLEKVCNMLSTRTFHIL